MTPKDLIAAYYASFNKQDTESFLSLLTEEVIHDINQGKREVGKNSFRSFMKIMDAHYEEKVVDLEIFTSENTSRAAAEFVIEGKYLKTQPGLPEARGQKYRLPVGAFFNIKDGKISRISNHYNLQDWIDQVSK